VLIQTVSFAFSFALLNAGTTSRQDRDNGYDHQELDQRKAGSKSMLEFIGFHIDQFAFHQDS